MKIGKIWDFEYPWDVRVEKVAETLLDAGHEVHLFCRNRAAQPEYELLGRLHIHRMRNRLGKGNWLENVSSFPAFVNPRWAAHIVGGARRLGLDVLLCRDLPLAPLAIWAGKYLGIPVVVDIAENYPAMLKHRFTWKEFRPHNLLVRNPYLAMAVERYMVTHADGVLAVVEESRERLIELGANPDRVDVVCNTPLPRRVDEMGRIAAAASNATEQVRLVYLGLLGHSRGVVTLVRGLRLLRDAGHAVACDVIGRDEHGAVAAEVARQGLEEVVTLHGHLPYDEALKIVAQAQIGVVPHHATEHWSTTIPNKLFDYMAAGIPVLVSDAPPTKRIVEENACGRVFSDRNPADLAAQVIAMLDPDVRRRLGDAGKAAVRDHYNWQVDGKKLLDHVEAVVRRHSAGELPGFAIESLPR